MSSEAPDQTTARPSRRGTLYAGNTQAIPHGGNDSSVHTLSEDLLEGRADVRVILRERQVSIAVADEDEVTLNDIGDAD